MDKVKMQALGLRPGGETRRHVLEVLGWQDPRNQPTSIHLNRFQSEKDSLRVTIEDINTAGTTVLSEPGNSENWDPSDISQVVRLITYSYVLSKYKSFRRREKAVGTQLDPSLPLGVGARVMADVKNEAYHVWSQPARVARDFESMQNWVSELSFSWLKTMAAGEFGSDSMMIMLLDKTMRKSGKGLTSVPSYVGWLTIRQVMVRTSTPVLLLVKRFCDKGFHTNYFLVKLEDTSPDRSKRGPDFTGANSGIAWHLTQVSADELMTSNNLKPHLTIYGSSLDGTIEDYMSITSQPVHRHQDVNCPQNIEHCCHFLATNHDDIGFSIMAEHRHYAFPVTDEAGRDEVEIVADIMNDVIPGLSVHWRKQKDEAFAIGTCRSFKTFMWQHVLLETVGRAAALLAASDGVLPISAPIALP